MPSHSSSHEHDFRFALRMLGLTVIVSCAWIIYRSPHVSWLGIFAVASVASRLWTYHREYDNIVLVFLLAALGICAIQIRKPIVLIFLIGLTLVFACLVITRTRWLQQAAAVFRQPASQSVCHRSGIYVVGRFAVGPSSCRKESDSALTVYYDGTTDLGYQPVPRMTARLSAHFGDDTVDSEGLNVGFHADPFVSCEPRLADKFLGPESYFFEVAEPQ